MPFNSLVEYFVEYLVEYSAVRWVVKYFNYPQADPVRGRVRLVKRSVHEAYFLTVKRMTKPNSWLLLSLLSP